MGNVRILEVKQSIFESNDKQAALLREELKRRRVLVEPDVIAWIRQDNDADTHDRGTER